MTPGGGWGAAPGRFQARPTDGGEAADTARARGWGCCGNAGGRQEAQRLPRRLEVGGDRAGRGATEKRGGGGDGARAQPTPRARRRPDNKQPRAGRCRSRCLRPRATQPGSPGLSPPPSSLPAHPPSSPRLSIADPIGPPRGNGVSRRAGAGGLWAGAQQGARPFLPPPIGSVAAPARRGRWRGASGTPSSAPERLGLGSAGPETFPYPTLAAHRLTGTRARAASGQSRTLGGGSACFCPRPAPRPARTPWASLGHLWAPEWAPWGDGATPPQCTVRP